MIIALSPLRLPGLRALMRRAATAPVLAPATCPEDADAVRATMDGFMRHNVEMDRGQLEMLTRVAEPQPRIQVGNRCRSLHRSPVRPREGVDGPRFTPQTTAPCSGGSPAPKLPAA